MKLKDFKIKPTLTTKEQSADIIAAPVKELYSEAERALGQMIASNPALKTLIDTFSLVNPDTNKPYRIPQSNTTQTPEIKPKQSIKEIAEAVLKENESKTKTEMIDAIKAKTGVSEERAERGLLAMIESGHVAQTKHLSYYLTNSTPF